MEDSKISSVVINNETYGLNASYISGESPSTYVENQISTYMQNHTTDLEITENGNYKIIGAYNVDVNVPTYSIQSSKTNNNLFSTTTPDAGYDAMSSVTNYKTVQPTYLAVPTGYTLLDYLVVPASETPEDLTTCAYCDVPNNSHPNCYRGVIINRNIPNTAFVNPIIINHNGSANRTRIYTNYTGGYRRFIFSNGASSSTSPVNISESLNNRIMCVGMGFYSGFVMKPDDTNSIALPPNNSTTGTYDRLFANIEQGCNVDSKFYVSSSSISSGDVYLLLPMQNSEGTVGVYDMVNNQFYSSLGVPFEAGDIAANQLIPVYQLTLGKSYEIEGMSIVTSEFTYQSAALFETDNTSHIIPLTRGIFLFRQDEKNIIISVGDYYYEEIDIDTLEVEYYNKVMTGVDGYEANLKDGDAYRIWKLSLIKGDIISFEPIIYSTSTRYACITTDEMIVLKSSVGDNSKKTIIITYKAEKDEDVLLCSKPYSGNIKPTLKISRRNN